jgi:hypothetical protein
LEKEWKIRWEIERKNGRKVKMEQTEIERKCSERKRKEKWRK